jgi:RimJ/RimL family protein N-acetyltransferase
MYSILDTIGDYLPKVEGVTFSRFYIEDAFDIEGGEFSGLSTQKMIGVKNMLEAQANHGFAVTCFLHGKPVAVFGCCKLWDGVGEMWSVIGDTARRKPIATTKIGIAFTDMCKLSLDLHRLQITVKTTDLRAMRWARAIGFISECTMKQYSMDKHDYDLMVRR